MKMTCVIAEDCHTAESVQLDEVLSEDWKKNLVSNAQWVGTSLIWKDKDGNLIRMSEPGKDQVFISSDIMVSQSVNKDFFIFHFFLISSLKCFSIKKKHGRNIFVHRS